MKLSGTDLFLINLPAEIEVSLANQSFCFEGNMFIIFENMADGFTIRSIDDNEVCHNTKSNSSYQIKEAAMYCFKNLMEFLNIDFTETKH